MTRSLSELFDKVDTPPKPKKSSTPTPRVRVKKPTLSGGFWIAFDSLDESIDSVWGKGKWVKMFDLWKIVKLEVEAMRK